MKALSGLFGGGQSMPKYSALQTVAPPVAKVMPTADDDAIAKARKKTVIEASQRSGRSSTILTNNDNNDSLGA